jgi:hypothetical protein
MGQTTGARGAARKTDENGAVEARTAASLVARVRNATKRETYPVPLIGDIIVEPLMRDVMTTLPIDEDSAPEDDELHIVAATVIDPDLSSDEWGQLREVSPIGVWGAIMQAVGQVNGMSLEFSKAAARRFRD